MIVEFFFYKHISIFFVNCWNLCLCLSRVHSSFILLMLLPATFNSPPLFPLLPSPPPSANWQSFSLYARLLRFKHFLNRKKEAKNERKKRHVTPAATSCPAQAAYYSLLWQHPLGTDCSSYSALPPRWPARCIVCWQSPKLSALVSACSAWAFPAALGQKHLNWICSSNCFNLQTHCWPCHTHTHTHI